MHKQLIIRICDKAIEWCFYTLLVVVAFSNSLVEIAAGIMIAAWFIKKALDRDLSAVPVVPAVIMLLIWAWTLLSCFNSGYFSESFRGVFKIVKYGIIFIIASSELNKGFYVKRSLWVFVFSAVLASLNGFYQYFSGEDLFRHRELQPEEIMKRISSSFVHPNDFGVYLLVVCSVFLSQTLSRSEALRKKILFLPALAVSALALFLTKSRGAWLSFVAAVMALGALKSKKVVLFFVAVLITLAVFAPPSMRERISSGFDITRGTTWERLQLWKGTIEMIKIHPVLGFGVNTYSRNFPQYMPEGYTDARYAHNCYLHMAAETGVPGVLIFLAFLLSVFIRAAGGISVMRPGMRKDLATGLFAGTLGFAINSAVDTHLYSVTLATFFYVLLGYCLALTSHEKT